MLVDPQICGRQGPVINFGACGGVRIGARLHRPPRTQDPKPFDPHKSSGAILLLETTRSARAGSIWCPQSADAKMSPPAVTGIRTAPARWRPAPRERETCPRHYPRQRRDRRDVAGRHAARKMLISERGQTARSATWQARLTSRLGTWKCPTQARVAEGRA